MAVLRSIGILGAGTTGSAIAGKAASEGFQVVLVDTKPEYLEQALDSIRKSLEARVTHEYTFPESIETILQRIKETTDSAQLKHTQLVLETVADDSASKIDVLRNLSKICSTDTILSTSTNSTKVKDLGRAVSHQGRFVGVHFFQPQTTNPLAEAIRTDKTSNHIFNSFLDALRLIGMATVVSDDTPGCIVRRILGAYLSEAVRALTSGEADIPTIDSALKDAFGVPLGPFGLMNTKGIYMAEQASLGLVEQFGSLYAQPERLRAQVASGREWCLDGEIDDEKRSAQKTKFLGLAFLVSTAIVEEGVAGLKDVNLACKLGLGWAKGPFELMEDMGMDKAKNIATDVALVHDVAVPSILDKQAAQNRPWSYNYVDLNISENVATITLNRPDARNALNKGVIDQLDKALDKVENNNSVRVVVFVAAAKEFPSGLETDFLIDRIRKNKTDDILTLKKRATKVLNRISALKKMTVTRADGLTLSFGIELGLASKAFIAGPRARFAFPETGWGIHPGLGGTQRLPRKVGKSIGKYLILTGDVLSADAAVRLGVVDALIDEDESVESLIANLAAGGALLQEETIPTDDELSVISLFDAKNSRATLAGNPPKDNPSSEQVARVLALKAPIALQLADKLIEEGLSLDLNRALALEHASLELILKTKDACKGLESIGNDPPPFKGE